MNGITLYLPFPLVPPIQKTCKRALRRTLRPPNSVPARTRPEPEPDCGIPIDDVKTLARFTSLHNHIQVLQVSRRADHPFAGSRLLLLDHPGNIHSISFLFSPFTSTYFDVFATLPPILPNPTVGPIALFGFGAGSAARLLLHLYPNLQLHGWELDPSVISVARQFFGLDKLESQYLKMISINIGDCFAAEIGDGFFAGILVDLFSKGRVVRELQEVGTWEWVKRKLRRGGRVMVNLGGRCVEAEENGSKEYGMAVMEETLEVMGRVFGGDEVWVLRLGEEDSCVAVTGERPDFGEWKGRVVKELRGYVDMWVPYKGTRKILRMEGEE